MAFWAIMSLSIVVNLPGLAVTPMLGTLSEIFPHTTQIEKQLLTVLPNLLIIPFVLLSGKLSMSHHKIAIIITALVIYSACGVLYMFADSMGYLIVISSLLGCGAGLLIPFSTGLIADTFVGSYRMKEMGLQSGISNMTLVAATFAVGWLSHGNWHIPFLVYLVALIPLGFSFRLHDLPAADLDMTPVAAKVPVPESAAGTAKVYKGFYITRLLAVVGVYFFFTFSTIVISYYCPFLIEKKHWSSGLSGTVTSLYFLFIFLPGFALPWIVKRLKEETFLVSTIFMACGLGLFAIFKTPWAMCLGAVFCGFGYGICQPLIYDKASRTVNTPAKSTMGLAIVLTANYLAIVLTPFIIDGIRSLLHAGGFTGFAFWLNFVLTALFIIVVVAGRKSFAFALPKEFYSDGSANGNGGKTATSSSDSK